MAITRIKTNQITDLAVTNDKIANATITGGKLANSLTYSSDLTVSGNLTVSGTTTAVSTTNTRVDDALLVLAQGTSGSPSEDSGLLIDRGSSSNVAFFWDESADQFVLADVGSEDGDTVGNVSISSYAPVQMGALTSTSITASGAVNIDDTTASSSTSTGALIVDGGVGVAGTVYATAFNGPLTGNASTASALSGSVTVALSGDVTGSATFTSAGDTASITTTIAANSVALGTDTTGNYVATIADAGNSAITVTNSGSENAAVTLDVVPERIQDIVGAMFTTTNTESGITVTYQDATHDIDLNVDDFTITLGGDLTGSVTITDLANATLNATIAANSVELGTDTTGNYVATITGGNGITSSGATTGESIAHSLSVDLTDTNIFTSGNTVSRAVVRDGSGNFSAGTITANIDGIIGGNTPAAGTFTTLTASGTTNLNGAVNLGDASGDAIAIVGTATFTQSADFDGGFTVAASQTLNAGANKITNVADPVSAQDAATKAYVDSEVSSGSALAIAGDSGTDTVTVGTDTFTFAGTANEVATTVTNNQVQIGLASDVNISNNLVVAGNLTVNGTTTTLSTTNSVVSDALIELNSGATSNANDLGLIFERGSTGDNAVFAWDESADKFTLGTTSATGASTGDLTITSGTLVAALEGNASTASALQTARAIALSGDVTGTANFDGSAGITISTTIAANSVALGTDTTGNYVQSIADAGSSQFTITNGTAEGGAATIALANNAVTLGTHTTGNYVATITGGAGIASSGATTGESIAHSLSVDLTDTSVFNSDGTVSTAVVLDGSGNFSAGTITASLTGTASTATQVTATANDATNETVYLTFVDGQSGAQDIETDISLTWNPSTNTLAAANVTGNASTASALAVARAIALSGDVTGTANFDGSAGITISTTIAANSVALGTDTTGNYVDDITGGAGITVTHTPGEGSDPTVAVDLADTNIFTSTNTASRAVVRDGSGNFAAGTVTTTNIDGILGANTAAAATVTTLTASGLAQLDGGMDVDGAFVVANTTGNISTTGTAIIGSATPTTGVTLKIDATDSMLLPAGTTSNRPVTPVTGMFRYNTTGNNLEYYSNTAWTSLSSDFTVATSQTFNGDSATTAFTLSSLSGADSYTTAGLLVMLNGVVQQPTEVYSVSGTTLTFTTAPATGDLIEVRKFTTTTTVTALSDSDGDTLVQAEESADEDKVRIDAGGSEIAVFDASGITLTTGSFVGTATQAQYADLAERYASDSYIDAGTVVEFVGEGKVAVCETDGTRSVAGVVSTDPAYLMNSKQEGVNLALAGRVPVKVTGSIQAGDLLVAAGNGRARAEADPKLGTVIGKAIETHTGDEGVIEVLILMM